MVYPRIAMAYHILWPNRNRRHHRHSDGPNGDDSRLSQPRDKDKYFKSKRSDGRERLSSCRGTAHIIDPCNWRSL